jgi:hypothetical protein
MYKEQSRSGHYNLQKCNPNPRRAVVNLHRSWWIGVRKEHSAVSSKKKIIKPSSENLYYYSLHLKFALGHI